MIKLFAKKPTKNSGSSVSYSYSQSMTPLDQKLVEPMQTKSMSSVSYTIDMLANMASSTDYISDNDAMGIEAFYSCVQDQASTIGSLPLRMYRSKLLNDRPERVRSGKEFRIFCEQPCEFLDLQGFIEFIVMSYRTNGAFYALVTYDVKGRVDEIVPFVNQASVKPLMGLDGNVYYTYATNDGKLVGPIPGDHMFIVKNMSMDGYTPIRPLSYQAKLLNIASSQDDNYRQLQDNGITSQMALITESKFDDKNARNRLKEDMDKFRGPNGFKEIPIFEQGLKPTSLNLTPQEMDLLSSREFSLKRVCAITETMPHRISAETIKSTDKIYELDEAQFKKWNPLITKIEHAFNRIGGRYMTFKFDRKAFYAGSPARLVEAVERELKGGMASIAEAREDLGRDYIPDTENLFCIESNNCTYGSWSELKQNKTEEGESNE